MDTLETVAWVDLVALKLRCAQDAIRRAFDELENDRITKVGVEYIRKQTGHANDYLDSAGRILDRAMEQLAREISDRMEARLSAPAAELGAGDRQAAAAVDGQAIAQPAEANPRIARTVEERDAAYFAGLSGLSLERLAVGPPDFADPIFRREFLK